MLRTHFLTREAAGCRNQFHMAICWARRDRKPRIWHVAIRPTWAFIVKKSQGW